MNNDKKWVIWAKFFDNLPSVAEYFYLIPDDSIFMKLIALALSVAKWHPSRGYLRGYDTCALCLYSARCNQSNNRDPWAYKCVKCPLYHYLGTSCLNKMRKDHGNIGFIYADKLYKILLKLYYEEYKRIDKEWMLKDIN